MTEAERARVDDWKIYRGDGTTPPDWKLPDPPPWRDFATLDAQRATTFRPPPDVVEAVNAAVHLRRPLLVTGDPGTGKSSLAYSIAHELGIGPVLTWNINSRSTLTDGLYQYDALARLREASLRRAGRASGAETPDAAADDGDIGRYVQLGALGTAFVAPGPKPRVVLVDEIDKSDVDLPNDLLHVFENGAFEIPELVRIADRQPRVTVATSGPPVPDGERAEDDAARPDVAVARRQVEVVGGQVQCTVFPIVVITSNGERDLPPAFLRRCLRVNIEAPRGDELAAIVRRHLPHGDATVLADLLAKFDAARAQQAMLATDQLLNAFHLVGQGRTPSDAERATLERMLLRPLDRA